MGSVSDLADSGLQVLLLPITVRLADALLAVISGALVTFVYILLIRRAWPSSTSDFNVSQRSIYLFNIGKMQNDDSTERVAKGRAEYLANPLGPEQRRALWLTSGSGLTKNIVQLLIWEWVSVWLVILMTIGTLLFNGFFTNNLNPDSWPRLTIMLIYLAAYVTHFCYVWLACLEFFRMVFAGAAWSLLERAKFVVADAAKLQSYSSGMPYGFRAIDKANENFVPTICSASLTIQSQTAIKANGNFSVETEQEDPAEVRAALATVASTQRTERGTAIDASTLALDRVVANAMVAMGVTLSTGFASWTSEQMSDQTPNNTTTTQIGSLALFTSFSIGAATMFTSAMNLNIATSAFRTILSLKEVKINGMAVDHYKKRRRDGEDDRSGPRSLAFTQSSVPLAEVGLGDFIECLRLRSASDIANFLLFGPAYAILP
ncbi:hypothetical protein F5B19DRAFT_492171 [Rostrohypoxylon terebratum]|nr:hypothetical protein F5B19DRAFT_492171 [Rostrohypoxylon terebratum]